MSSPSPIGLLATEVVALRAAAGISVEEFANAFGVGPNIVEHWESLGVPTGPTALAIRFVAQSMEFEFPVPELGNSPCVICGAPASETFRGMSVCPSCHRDPVKSMEALGFEASRSHNIVSNQTNYELRLPAGRRMQFSGRFLSEGVGTMLTKLFKEEPQTGHQSWDDAVYVQWIEPGIEAIGDPPTREIVQALVSFGTVDVEPDSIVMQHVPTYGSFDYEILLLCGLLASRQP